MIASLWQKMQQAKQDQVADGWSDTQWSLHFCAVSHVKTRGRRMSPNIRTYCRILLLKFGIRMPFFKFGKKPNFAEFRISNF